MRKSNAQNIKAIIDELVNEFNIGPKLKEASVVNLWHELLGKQVSKATRLIYVKDHKLFVFLNSSVIRNELLMMKISIIEKINSTVGEDIIKDIILQ